MINKLLWGGVIVKNYLGTGLFVALVYLCVPTVARADTIYACRLNSLGTVRLVSATAALPCG